MPTAITDELRCLLEQRAANPLSTQPRSFVRWAGSKRSLLKHIIPHLPASFGKYYEPFLGSGALFFLLRPFRAHLNDSCVELISSFVAVRDNAPLVAKIATEKALERDEYYRIREYRSTDDIRRAAEFLYLNRGCFNGLYRVNGSGKFNVPWGAPKSGFVVDERNLLACQEALAAPGVILSSGDFDKALVGCRRGDLIYLDPPYVTQHNNNGFVDYNERIFSWADQERLAEKAEALRRRGCHVIVTNANHRDVLSLYPHFKSYVLRRSSTLASSRHRRGTVTEAILVGRS